MTTGVLILAAGQSRRFGPANKLLALIGGQPMIARVIALAAQRDIAQAVLVASAPDVAALARAAGLRVVLVPVDTPQSGSLRAGITVLQSLNVLRVLILLGDMPFLTPADIEAVLTAGIAEGTACALLGVTPLPPAIFPATRFAALASLSGDRGAGALLWDVPQHARLTLPEPHLRDIDFLSDLPPEVDDTGRARPGGQPPSDPDG